jgi:hypothetical protein
MSEKPENPSAFPNDYAGRAGADEQYCQFGMTLRDYFAAAALQGVVGSQRMLPIQLEELQSEWQSRIAYHYADSMLKARES